MSPADPSYSLTGVSLGCLVTYPLLLLLKIRVLPIAFVILITHIKGYLMPPNEILLSVQTPLSPSWIQIITSILLIFLVPLLPHSNGLFLTKWFIASHFLYLSAAFDKVDCFFLLKHFFFLEAFKTAETTTTLPYFLAISQASTY